MSPRRFRACLLVALGAAPLGVLACTALNSDLDDYTGGTRDAGNGDVGHADTSDATHDGNDANDANDTAPADSGDSTVVDSGPDAPADTRDGAADTRDGGEASVDSGIDSAIDSSIDTADGGVDSVVDSGVDTIVDTGPIVCAPATPDGPCDTDAGVDGGDATSGDAGVTCYAGACVGACAVGVNGTCSSPTDTCDTTSGTCVPAVAPVAGEVVISEVLIDAPTVGTTSEVGELVELYNASSKTVNINGCSLRSQSGASTESTAAFGDVPIPPYHFVALVKLAAATSFDFPVAATYGTIQFSNSGADYVALQCPSGDIDGVGWHGATAFPNVVATPPADTTRERSTASLSLGADTASTVWCNGLTTHTITNGTGSGTFKGSPAAPNACP